MSREHTGNSFASFGSNFDPEHEAIASTREMGHSPRLPPMNGSARKNIQHIPEEEDEPDYVFNTSTMERVFPEFSQIGTTSEEEADHEEDDDSISIEAGRGPSKPARRLDDSRNSYLSVENSVRSSSPAVRLDYPTSQTPPKSAMRNPARRAVSDNLRKDAQLRRASLAQKENIDPQSKPTSRRDQRRTLSDMHAKVRDSYDGSFIADERPQVASSNARPTRFGNAQIADAVEKASQDAYAKELRKSKLPNGSRNANVVGDTATQQSFLLPDLPNLSELVSGIYEDGTPVYSRQNKARTTRFTSPPHEATRESVTREHMPLDAVPIPEDEKALFVSLRLLQDKVAELERANSDAERRMEEIRHENKSLKSGKSRQKDKHGRRMYEPEEDDRLAKDNQKLEAANLALQNKLDIFERKVEIQDSSLKRLNRERDMAVSQLGVAYLESQDLKNENESLRQENASLKARLDKLGLYNTKSRETTLQSEQTSASEEDTEDSQVNTQRSASANLSRGTKENTARNSRSRSKHGRREDSRAKISNQVDKEISRLEKERADDALFSIDVPRSREPTSTKEKQPSRTESKKSNTGKQRVKRVVVEEVDVTEPVESTGEATGNTRKSATADQDVTLLSYVDEHEIAQLRKTLEEERLSRKRRQSASRDQTANDTEVSTRSRASIKPALSRKASKETKTVPSRPASAMGDLTATSKPSLAEEDSNNFSVPIERPRRHSDHSSTPRRRQRVVEEMTSAFIMPDITLRRADLAAENPSRLPEPTQRALDANTRHNGKNCTVCHRTSCDHTRSSVTVLRPIPVSQRMPEPSLYNEDPTMRPAQPPAVALATVLKGLEDELSHLKMQLVTYQSAYNKLDASLSKRQRKSLGEKIEKLLKDVDMKADQIYALYDVLEGQRHGGREMTEQEMEVTLQSIGIDATAHANTHANANAGKAADVTATTDKPTVIDDEEDEELPWEGIESTMDVSGRSGLSRRN